MRSLPWTDQQAGDTARMVNADEGIPVGISSGATIAAAMKIAQRRDWAGKRIVVICARRARNAISPRGCMKKFHWIPTAWNKKKKNLKPPMDTNSHK